MDEDGLFLRDGGEEIPLHTSGNDDDPERLREYIRTWDLPTHEVLFLTVYFNEYPEDGYEIGGIYTSREKAKEVAEEQSDIDMGWENSSVIQRDLVTNNE
jgi:hypothetical protein